MRDVTEITHLFVDIGGVLLSDGWGHEFRARAAKEFDLNWEEMEARHQQAFETYEVDKLSLEEYLRHVVFYQKRLFTAAQFQEFMFVQSTPCPEMIDLVRRLKARYGLRIVVVSNEARAMNTYRIRKFKLAEFVDSFISSSFVGLRKPDADIFRLALDTAQAPVRQVVYLENTPMFVQIAEEVGIRSILHRDYEPTRAKLASFGLHDGKSVIPQTTQKRS